MIEETLSSLGITLPTPPAAAGSYVPVVISGNLAFVAGQIPVEAGRVKFMGKVGKDLPVEAGGVGRVIPSDDRVSSIMAS